LPVKGYSALEVEGAFARARKLAEQLDNPPEMFFVLLGLRAVHFIRGRYRLARELDEQMLLQVQASGDPALMSLVHWQFGITSYQIGEMLLARQQLETALSFYDRERDRPRALLLGVDPGLGSVGYLGQTLWTLGFPDQALQKGNEGVALGQGLVHPTCANTFFRAVVHQFRREADKAQRLSEKVIAVSSEHGFTLWLALATFLLRWAMIEQGNSDTNVSQLRDALAAVRATEAQVGRPYQLWLLAHACTNLGRLREGLDALNEASVVAEQNGEHNWDAEIHRLRGDLLLNQDDSSAAEARNCFERAIAIARKQSTKSFELRATRSLARLLAWQGRREEARERLTEIYNWFTEGFDTADLKDAKALLNQLSN
jgi:tetratricopeptide (TPR) repeat protein